MSIQFNWFALIPIAIGLVSIAIGLAFYFRMKNRLKTYKYTFATVSHSETWTSRSADGSLQSHFKVLLDYCADGRELHDQPCSYYDSSMKVGKRILIAFAPEKPESYVFPGGSRSFAFAFVYLGAVFLIAPFLLMLFFSI